MAGHAWIGTGVVPGGVEMRLMQRDDQFTILLSDTELMSTRASASEAALATMTYERLYAHGGTAGSHANAGEWLIGGYGLGYTLRAALGVLGAQAQVTVAEIAPEIIAWARGPMHALTDGCLDDARVTLVDGDVAMLIDAAHDAYDAILLDVDNGPEGLSRGGNDDLYDNLGLHSARAALRTGGILAIWSAFTDPAFTVRLEQAGFAVQEVAVDENDARDAGRHVIWFARKG